MIINLIILGIIVICLGVIIYLVTKYFSRISTIDTSNIPEEKQATVKSSLMEQRLARKFETAGGIVKKIIIPVYKKISEYLVSLKNRVATLEKHYRERSISKKAPTLEEKESNRQKVNKLFIEAETAFKSEDWAEAEKKYLEIISLDMKNIEAYESLGWTYYETKDFEHAKETFEFIKKLNSKNDEIYYGLGVLYSAMDRKEEALLNFKDAATLSPNSPKNLDALLNLALEMKDKFLAETTFDKLRQVNPENQKLDELKEKIQAIGK